MREYKIEKYPGKGHLYIFCSYEGFQLWALSNQFVRKNHECVMCKKKILKGKDQAYRPITNLNNRMDRICFECGKEK